jgi:hypothetical protein
MPIETPLTPQIEQFIYDNPQGVLTSFRRNGSALTRMRQARGQ